MEPREDLMHDLEFLGQNVERLNQQWYLTDQPIPHSNSLFGKLALLLKRCIRKTVYWLLRSYIDQQIVFNRTACDAISDIYRIQSSLLRSIESPLPALPEDKLRLVSGPRVIQLVSTLSPGDAVGNEVVAFKRTLQENGFATEIYASHISNGIPAGTARYYKDMPELRAEDIVIYHFASECTISKDIKDFPCKVILRYHNVTPPEFFHGFDENAEKATANGLRQVKEIMPYISSCLPVSEFNMRDLQKMGYTCPMDVLPILMRFEDYGKEPDPKIVEQYSDGITNILFVGRMAPNKKVEDVISGFSAYKERYDPTARLFLVGSFQETDKYYQYLQRHIQKLGVQDVIFPGHIPFAAILAYYKVADAFLCMSEHEGFCVPLVEAMYFGVPIVAFDSCAVGNTLGDCGILVRNKEVNFVSESINVAVKQKNHFAELDKLQLKLFERDKITHRLLELLRHIY